MTVDLSVLDAANVRLQADLSARQSTRAFASAVTAAWPSVDGAGNRLSHTELCAWRFGGDCDCAGESA